MAVSLVPQRFPGGGGKLLETSEWFLIFKKLFYFCVFVCSFIEKIIRHSEHFTEQNDCVSFCERAKDLHENRFFAPLRSAQNDGMLWETTIPEGEPRNTTNKPAMPAQNDKIFVLKNIVVKK